MAESVSCKIEGLDELEDALLNQTTKKARSGMREALQAVGDFLRLAMVLKVPSRTGFLARHIISKITLSTKQDEGTVSVGPSKEAFYAQFVEFGSIHNRPPEPFMRPAYDENKEKAVDVFAQKLRNFLGL